MPDVVRIAMWSGPRNISTAMMRAFENRTDTAVTNETLYGHYLLSTGLDLLSTGLDHPDRKAVIRRRRPTGGKWRRRLPAPCRVTGGSGTRSAMLAWPPGPRPSDGVWAKNWCANVWRSAGFRPNRAPAAPLPEALQPLVGACAPTAGCSTRIGLGSADLDRRTLVRASIS